jgi:hypothetical protein
VRFLVTTCGNVYDYAVENVRDEDYDQPDTPMNHYPGHLGPTRRR